MAAEHHGGDTNGGGSDGGVAQVAAVHGVLGRAARPRATSREALRRKTWSMYARVGLGNGEGVRQMVW